MPIEFISIFNFTEISVVLIPEKLADFQKYFSPCAFPVLKNFKFDSDKLFKPTSPTYSTLLDFLKKVVQSAPELEEFHLNDFVSSNSTNMDEYNQCLEDLVSQVLDSSRALLVFDQNHRKASDLSTNCLSRLAVRNFHVMDCYLATQNYDVWKIMLKNSMRQLEKAKLNIQLLTEVFLNEIPMVRLERLYLSISRHYEDAYSPLLDVILRKHVWKRCLPNFKVLFLGEDAVSDGSAKVLIPELISRLNRAPIISCTEEEEDNSRLEVESIEHFQRHSFLPEVRCAFFCDLCPHVRHLELVQPVNESFVPHFYNRLQSVEHLNWSQVYPERNVDHRLCGIHPEEAELLKKKDIEYLKRVHIVPVEPSITFLTSKLPEAAAVKLFGTHRHLIQRRFLLQV